MGGKGTNRSAHQTLRLPATYTHRPHKERNDATIQVQGTSGSAAWEAKGRIALHTRPCACRPHTHTHTMIKATSFGVIKGAHRHYGYRGVVYPPTPRHSSCHRLLHGCIPCLFHRCCLRLRRTPPPTLLLPTHRLPESVKSAWSCHACVLRPLKP